MGDARRQAMLSLRRWPTFMPGGSSRCSRRRTTTIADAPPGPCTPATRPEEKVLHQALRADARNE